MEAVVFILKEWCGFRVERCGRGLGNGVLRSTKKGRNERECERVNVDEEDELNVNDTGTTLRLEGVELIQHISVLLTSGHVCPDGVSVGVHCDARKEHCRYPLA